LAVARVGTPPRVVEAERASAGSVEVLISPMIIDVNPISAVPGEAEEV
jgi:hypothetical protein